MKALVTFVPLLTLFPAMASGQLNCKATANVEQSLVCLVPFNVGTAVGRPGLGSAAQTASLPINGSIAAQLTQLPVPSGTSGTIILQEKGKLLGGTFDDLGPVLTLRPETVGARHLYAGFTFQRFKFNALDGNPIGSLQFGFTARTGPTQTYYGSNTANIHFKLDQYVALVTYGATKTTDLSVVLPFNSVYVSAASSNYLLYSYSDGKFQDVTNTVPSFNSGSAAGLGDIKFGVKQQVYGGDGKNLAVSAGLGFRIPSGDALNFLGSGAYGVDLYGLVAYRSSKSYLSPHFKIGKQWNGSTVLLNPNGSGDARLPGGMQYEAGTDIKIYPRKVTLSLDVIGSQFTNAPTLSAPTVFIDPTGAGSPLPALTADLPVDKTYTKVTFSSGIKFAPLKTTSLIFYGNVLLQLNNVGLRSDPVPLVGASYNFKFRKEN